MSYRWLAALSLAVVAACGVLFVALGRRPERWPEPVRTETAVGDSTCISCHRDKATFEGTAHRLTMRLPTRASILGNFRSGENVLRTSDPDVHVRMDADSAGFYQTIGGGEGAGYDQPYRAHRDRRRFRTERAELSLLVRRPLVSNARIVLDEPRTMDRESGSSC